jgi:hypothetical protein
LNLIFTFQRAFCRQNRPTKIPAERGSVSRQAGGGLIRIWLQTTEFQGALPALRQQPFRQGLASIGLAVTLLSIVERICQNFSPRAKTVSAKMFPLFRSSCFDLAFTPLIGGLDHTTLIRLVKPPLFNFPDFSNRYFPDDRVIPASGSRTLSTVFPDARG